MPDFLLLAHSIVGVPVLLAHRHPSRLSLLGIALALLAVLFPGFGRNSVSAFGTAPDPSAQATSGGGPGVVVASFSVTDDLSTALVGLINARDVTFVARQGRDQAGSPIPPGARASVGAGSQDDAGLTGTIREGEWGQVSGNVSLGGRDSTRAFSPCHKAGR